MMNEDPTRPPVDMDAKLEAEIEAALGDMSIEDMLDFADRPKAPRTNRELKTGTVVAIHGDDVFVEFGPKSQGVCPIAQFEERPALGERMDFQVDRFDRDEGILMLSRRGTVRKAEWESLEPGQVVEARCTGVNKGGLEMEVASHRAFMPAGQVDLRHIEDLSVFIGEKLPCEVIEVDRERARIILSRRAQLVADRASRREEILLTLEVGQTVSAVITSIQQYGAFADLGGIDGLIHISDLSFQRIKHPSEIVKEGAQVSVKVLRIERESEKGGPRIALGLKQTLEDPFRTELGKLEPNAEVTGRVTRIMPYGAFVEIAPGVEGLIHISELSHDRVHRVSSVVKLDEIVTARVLSIEPETRRVSLSLKAVKAATAESADSKRSDDPHLRKLKAQLNRKFGELKGGLS